MARIRGFHSCRTNERYFSKNNLESLSRDEFVEIWKIITGETPAIMLESRTEMLSLLFDGIISIELLGHVARTFPKGKPSHSLR
jgi:hypothetical protein